MSDKSKNNSIVDGLSELRGVAILAVIAIHTTHPIIGGRSVPDTSFFTFPIILNQISRFCVPVFIFMSGYLYGRKFKAKKIEYFVFLHGRGARILLPYLFWTMVYLIFNVAIGELPTEFLSVQYLIKSILFGSGASGHLYFIPLIFQFYLLLPAILWLYQTFIDHMLLLTSFLVILSMLAVSIKFHLPVLNVESKLFNISNFFFLWWLAFFAMGIHCGFKESDIADVRSGFLRMAMLTALVILALMVFEIRQYLLVPSTRILLFCGQLKEQFHPSYFATFLRPTAYAYALLTTLLISVVFMRKNKQPIQFMEELGKYSFGIYLSHILVITFINRAMKNLGAYPYQNIFFNIILFIMTVIISYYIVSVSSNYKFSRLLWGGTR